MAIGLGAALVVATVLSISIGARELTVSEIQAALFGHGTPETTALIWDYRIPRTLIAITVGGALGVAGALIQSLTRNPLADPGILGVNAGAAFAVTLTLGLTQAGPASLVWASLIGAALTTFAVVAIGSSGRGPATPMRLTLAGVALAAFLSGITAGLRLADPNTFDRYRIWSAGSVADRDLGSLLTVLPYAGIGLLLALFVSRGLNSMALGEDVATSLGTNVSRTRTITIIAITLLAGSATAVAGPIGFVGLMVPHAMRWVVGPDQRRIIPLSVLGGALLLTASDILGRVLLGNRELPVGVVTAFVGAPVLIALVRRKKVSGL